MIKNYLSLTKALVIFSILGSFASYYTIEKGWGEVYPFFTFKLFSQPLGNKHTYTEYRIYSKSSLDEKFKRNKIKGTETFTYEEYIYTFNHLIKQTLNDPQNKIKHKKNLLSFIKHVVPGQKEYKVVSETYHPYLYLINGSYDTATVITF
jgi:hypothetical protein